MKIGILGGISSIDDTGFVDIPANPAAATVSFVRV